MTSASYTHTAASAIARTLLNALVAPTASPSLGATAGASLAGPVARAVGKADRYSTPAIVFQEEIARQTCPWCVAKTYSTWPTCSVA